MLSVPSQVSSGPGWSYSKAANQVNVTGAGAVLSGLSIGCNLNITASNVTIKNDSVVTGGNYGISLRHTAGVTIENSTIRGLNAGSGEVVAAISDLYSDSTGTVVSGNDISYFNKGVYLETGSVTGNYIHDPGFVAGDHTDGVFDVGTTQPLTISGNTILLSTNQTGAISLDATLDGQAIANKTITDNLLGGGSWVIYAGSARSATTSNIVIKNNQFSQLYYPKSGLFGPTAYFDSKGQGNVWSGNTWQASGQLVPSP
jgi:hypothetical protein